MFLVSKLKKNADPELLESPGVKRLIQLNELIQLTEPSEMIEYIKCNSISFDEIPLNMKKHVAIWNYFLPTFNYENLIGSVMMLHDFELLTPAHPFAKVFSFKMGDTQKVKKAKIHPIEFLSVSRLFTENNRYLCPAKVNIPELIYLIIYFIIPILGNLPHKKNAETRLGTKSSIKRKDYTGYESFNWYTTSYWLQLLHNYRSSQRQFK